jgi:fluoroacetyl-CoA thioesterase
MSAGRGLTVGLRATVTAEVTDADTAIALGSGDVAVLGTPRLLALAEAASVAAVAPQLGSGQTSVGVEVSLEHSKPSPVGSTVEVSAELTEIHGRRLVFSFIAYTQGESEGDGEDAVLGAGTVQRMLVDRERFLATAAVPSQPHG